MKRIFIIFFLLASFFLHAQTDILWNSLLPNGMDFSRPTADMPYSYSNNAALSSLSDVVATAYLRDTLFATDGQKLYVILNGSLIGQYTLNRVKAGRDQAFLLTMFYGQSKRQLKIITSVDDTIKLFTWPNLTNYKILETDIEPVIYVSSQLKNDFSFPDTLYNTARITFIGRNYVPHLLEVYSMDYSSGSLVEEPYFSMFVDYTPPVSLLRYYDWYIFIKDADSVRTWVKDVNGDLKFHQVKAFPPTVKDIAMLGSRLFLLTDTALVNISHYYYTQNMPIEFYQKSIDLGNTWPVKQIIPTPYGQMLLYPDTTAAIIDLYNIMHNENYYQTVVEDVVTSTNPMPINLVGEYWPIFYGVPGEAGVYTYCQRIPFNVSMPASFGGYVYSEYINVPGRNAPSLFLADTIYLDSAYTSGVTTRYFSHSGQNYLIVTSIIQGLPVDFNVSYNQYDSSFTIYAGKNYINLVNSNISWIYQGNYLSDTTSELKVKSPGTYTLRIENPYNGCVYDTFCVVLKPQYFITDLIEKCSYRINNSNIEFAGSKTAFAVGDSLQVLFIPTYDTQPSPVISQFDYIFFWDGRFIGTDTSFVVHTGNSGMHHLDFVARKKDSLLNYSLIDFHTEFPVIAPHMRVILPKRKYAVGDTAKFVIASDTVNSDIYIDDVFANNNKVIFRQMNDSTWMGNITDSLALNKVITNPDSLSLILWLATNKANKLSFTLIAPDGKKADFYSGFNGNERYYFIGQPYCKQYYHLGDYTYSPEDYTRFEATDLDLYPVVFSPSIERKLASSDFENSYYADCYTSIENVPVLKLGDNAFSADFSALSGAPVYGQWTLIIHKNADSTLAFARPILSLPSEKIGLHYLKDTANNRILFNVETAYNSGLMEKLDNAHYVMKNKGEDSLTFLLRYYVYDRPVDMYNPGNPDLPGGDAVFYIKVEKRSVYYDNTTYSFSPNGDGINDFWNPLETIGNTYPILKEAQPSSLSVNIVNDKGLVIRSFTMAEQPKGWDGLDKDGRPVPGGMYWYIIIYRDQKYYGTIFIVK